MKRLLSSLASATLVLVVAAGCGSTPASEDAEAVVDFLVGGDAYQSFRAAHDARVVELTKICMLEAGFDGEVLDAPVAQSGADSQQFDDDYYGIVAQLDRLDADQRSQFESQGEQNSAPSPSGPEEAAREQALYGPGGTSGCAGSGRAKAAEEFDLDRLRAVEAEVKMLMVASGVSDDHERRVEAWADCMARQGAPWIESPAAIYDTVFEEWRRERDSGVDSGQAAQLEADIFAADAACDDPTAPTDMKDIARQLLEDNPELLEQLASMHDDPTG